MLKRLIVSLFALFLAITCDSQIRIVDKETYGAVPFAHVINENGKLIGTTNIDGILIKSEIFKEPVNNNSIVSIQHISYKNYQIELNTLLLGDTIFLLPNNIFLPEVTVKKRNTDPQYLAITGYFRSYQLNNGIPKFFTDGIVVYYIPLGRKKELKNSVLHNRSFRNEKLIQQEKKRSVKMEMVCAGIPYIKAETIIQDLDKTYSVVKETADNYRIENKNEKVGLLLRDSLNANITISIDLIAPEQKKVKTFLNYTSEILETNIIENYSSADIKSFSKNDLLTRKEYRKIAFKHKKENDFTEIEVIHEFYVLGKEIVYQSELKKIEVSNHFGLIRSTNFSQEYWAKLPKYNIPEISPNIENLFGKELILYD